MPDFKRVKIYPYFCEMPDNRIKINNFPKIFKITNASKNVLPHSFDTHLVLVIDETHDGFMFGRFFKLRGDAPMIFNKRRGNEREIPLLPDDEIKEESLFVWNMSDGVIFAEYNFNAIRTFGGPLSSYLNSKFGVRGCTVTPIFNADAFDSLKKEDEIFSMCIKFAQEKTRILEKRFGWPSLKVFSEITKGNRTYLKVTIAGRRGNVLNKNEVIDFAKDWIEKEAPVDSIRVEASEAVYDLIGDTVLSYPLLVRKHGRKLDKKDFNGKACALYNNKIETIKATIRTA